jgi:hypothetical protein
MRNTFMGILKIALLQALFWQSNLWSAAPVKQALIGQNYWLNVDPVWDQVEDMKPEIIRVGGIEFNSNYYGTSWYDEVLDNIESAGAAPMIQISEQWSSSQRASLLQHFVNTGRDIPYFSIGNEPDHNNRVSDVDDIINYYNTLGKEIRLYFPDAILIGPCWANFYDGFIRDHYFPFIDGTKNTRDHNGNYILNVFSFHTYASAYGSGGVPLFNLETFENRMDILLPKLAEVNNSRPQDEQLSWSVTELHTTYNNDSINVGGTKYAVPESHKTYNFYAGQYFAQIYGYAMKNGAFGIMPWSLIEGEQNRNFGDLGIFDHDYIPRSTYHHTQFLTENLKETAIGVSNNMDGLEVISMADETGVTLLLMNTQSTSYSFTLQLNTQSNPSSKFYVLTNADLDSQRPESIEGKTTLLLSFASDGTLLKRISYSQEDAENRTPPHEEEGFSIQLLPGKIEAEDYSDQWGLQTEECFDLNGGENLGWTSTGDWVEYTIDAEYSGNYTLEYRIASLNGNASFSTSLDGVYQQETLIASTEGWQNWESLYADIYLEKGQHTLRIDVTAPGFNLNWIDAAYNSQPPQLEFLLPEDNTFAESDPINFEVQASHPSGISFVELYLNDSYIRRENIAPYEWSDDELQNLPAGTYTISALAVSASQDSGTSQFIFTILPPQIPTPEISFTDISDGQIFFTDGSQTVHVETQHEDGISNVILYLNNDFVRQENIAPYDWYDLDLCTLNPGSYELKAIATTPSGIQDSLVYTIHVQNPVNEPEDITPEEPEITPPAEEPQDSTDTETPEEIPQECEACLSISDITLRDAFIEFNWIGETLPSGLNFIVTNAQGAVVRTFYEQNIHFDFNNIWIKDHHQLDNGVYLLSILWDSQILQSLSFIK